MRTFLASTSVAGISAPVGQACTHSPQATQVEAPIGSSKSNTIFSPWPRPAMPMTSLTCTSRQARTQRLHWMQASRLTAMAGWLRSGVGRMALAEAAGRDVHAVGPGPEFRLRIVRGLARGLVGHQQLEHHLPRGLGALGDGLHLHAFARLADAACGQHALALDLDHAGAAIAVGAVAGLGRIAQMRDVGAEALGHLPDGLAVARLDFLAVEDEFHRFCCAVTCGHGCQPSVTRFPAVFSVRRGNISARTAADWAPPGRGRRSRRRAWRSTVRSAARRPRGPAPSA